MEKKRSVGITIVGILFILNSLLSVGFIFSLTASMNSVSAIVSIGWALILFLTGIGILQLRSIARMTAIALIVIQAINATARTIIDLNFMIQELSSPKAATMAIGSLTLILGIGICIVIVYYLTRPKVKAQFK